MPLVNLAERLRIFFSSTRDRLRQWLCPSLHQSAQPENKESVEKSLFGAILLDSKSWTWAPSCNSWMRPAPFAKIEIWIERKFARLIQFRSGQATCIRVLLALSNREHQSFWTGYSREYMQEFFLGPAGSRRGKKKKEKKTACIACHNSKNSAIAECTTAQCNQEKNRRWLAIPEE